MAHRLIKQAIETYVPAVKEVIAAPAYTEVRYETREVTKWTDVYKTVNYTYYHLFNGTVYEYIIPTRVFAGVPYTVVESVPVYIDHPATTAVAGRDAVVTDAGIGWNGGAQSVEVLDGDFAIECIVSSLSQGVLVGIQPAGLASGVFNQLTHAILISGNKASAVENGAIKLAGGSFAGNLIVRISRVAGVVTAQAGTLRYVSPVQSNGPMVMSAVMYAGSDYVDDPQFSNTTSLSSVGDWGWGDGSGIFSLRAKSPWGWAGKASINDGEVRMSMSVDLISNDEDFSEVRLVMDAPTVSAGGFDIPTADSTVVLIPMQMQAIGISIGLMSGSLEFGMTMRSGDYDYSDVSLTLDGIDVFAILADAPNGSEEATEAAFMGDFYIVDPTAYASIVESLSIGSQLDLIMSLDADLADHLALMDDADVVSVILALIENKIGLADSSLSASRDIFNYVNSITGLSGGYDFSGHTYATNIVTGAVSRYAGFDFNGFCRVGMKSFAFRPDGLYALGADSDDGTAIGTRVDFAAEDFGSAQSKRVGNVFMGLSTDGQVFVRTTEDGGEEKIYRGYQRREEFRADMQRGRSSRFWRLRLEVVEASFTELDNIEWVITSTGRRSS